MLLAFVLIAGALQDAPVEPPPAEPPAVAPVPPIMPVDVVPPPVRALKVAVYDFTVDGVSHAQARVVMAAVLQELRKLEDVSVIGSDEIRVMLEQESNKQLLGCADSSCLAEIADALGVDVVVVGSLAKISDEHVFGMRRVDQKEAKVHAQITRRFDAGNGEEFLVSVGPAIAELFPDRALKPGEVRGVAEEMALRLNPPPLPTWVFIGGVGVTAACGIAAGTFGVLNKLALDERAQYATDHATDGKFKTAEDERLADAVDARAYSAYALGGATLAFAIASGVSALFTDFWGYAEMNEEALR